MINNRRNFIKKAAAGMAGLAITGGITGLSAKSYERVMGANDRIQIAIQGLGRRYGAYLDAIANKSNNVDLLFLCDVMKSQVDKALVNVAKRGIDTPTAAVDIRKVLENKNLDAVFMATPDHWHAPGACMAMQAGKHVYLEKPCSHNPAEGELLVAYQKKYKKMVQMGNQQRSSLESKEIIEEIHKGIIGDTHKAVAFYRNSRGAISAASSALIPDGLNWDLFQGPAPRKEYTHDTWNYNWHWYGWDYGTGESGNNGTHELDIARWALQVKYPEHASVYAGKFQHKDDGWKIYDTMEASFRFSDNKMIQWDCECRNAYNKYGADRGTIVYGSNGSVFIDRKGYKLFDLKGKLIKQNISTIAEGGTDLGGGGDLSSLHVVNFLDAVRGKSVLNSPIDEGAISQMLPHYANIAYRIGESFDIDENSGIIYNKKAMKLWSREYEPGWEIKNI